jgi:plastocyanin
MEENNMSSKYFIFVALLIMAGLVLAGCTSASAAELEPSEVTFDVSVIEVKGATDGIPAPEVDPQSLSAGYRFKAPGDYDADNPEKWQVSTYMFSPAAITVAQGDEVTLRTFVVNGDEHTVWIEAPDGSRVVENDVMNRGREYQLTFTAEQAGYYTLHCNEHAPTMSATILVLPNQAG